MPAPLHHTKYCLRHTEIVGKNYHEHAHYKIENTEVEGCLWAVGTHHNQKESGLEGEGGLPQQAHILDRSHIQSGHTPSGQNTYTQARAVCELLLHLQYNGIKMAPASITALDTSCSYKQQVLFFSWLTPHLSDTRKPTKYCNTNYCWNMSC